MLQLALSEQKSINKKGDYSRDLERIKGSHVEGRNKGEKFLLKNSSDLSARRSPESLNW